MKKVMILTTTAYHSERFNRENILLLSKQGYEVHVVANFDNGNPISDELLDEFKSWIHEQGGAWYSIPITRSPSNVSGFRKSVKMTVDLIHKNHYEFIHCHTPMGGVLGRVIARKTHTKVIYTAHGFHFYSGAPLLNWLVYYPIEKFLSRWTDFLITINHEDFNRASAKFHAGKTAYIPGIGIRLPEKLGDRDELHGCICEELGIPQDSYLALSVGELNNNKNHETVIRSLLLDSVPKNVHYLVCGVGVLEEYLERLIAELKLSDRVHLMGYRKDVPVLCQGVDVFVFPSKREGLSVALMEAVAAGLPVIASNARGNSELVFDGKNGILCPNNTVDEYADAFFRIVDFDRTSVEAEDRRIIAGFTREIVNERMNALYEEITCLKK